MRRLYLDEGLSTYEISKRLGISSGTVCYWLKQSGVTLRKMRVNPHRRIVRANGLPKRPCMRCRKPFGPKHKFNRLCDHCAHYIADNSSSLAPGW